MSNFFNSVMLYVSQFFCADIFKEISGENLEGYAWINDIVKFLNATIIPISITLLVAAAFLIIILSVLMAKAETGDDARKYRKRIVGVGVTVFIVLILLYFIGFFFPEIPGIIEGLKEKIVI